MAADDAKVVEALRPFGTTCVLTDPRHPSGTDRVAEAARGRSEQIVVNVQADEPEIEPQTIDALVERLEAGSEAMATAATRFPAEVDPADANLVKVIVDLNGRAIYFSRLPIPYCRDAATRLARRSPTPGGWRTTCIWACMRIAGTFCWSWRVGRPRPAKRRKSSNNCGFWNMGGRSALLS